MRSQIAVFLVVYVCLNEYWSCFVIHGIIIPLSISWSYNSWFFHLTKQEDAEATYNSLLENNFILCLTPKQKKSKNTSSSTSARKNFRGPYRVLLFGYWPHWPMLLPLHWKKRQSERYRQLRGVVLFFLQYTLIDYK